MQGIQTLYYNIYEKRWDKRNVGDAQVAWFGNKSAENIVITESFMDATSSAQVIAKLKNMDYRDVLDNYLFISANGQYSNLKKETIKRFLEQNIVGKVILAHYNDKAGESFDKMYLKNGEFYELVKDKNLVVFKPAMEKDWNDFIRNNELGEDFKDKIIMEKAENYYKSYMEELKLEEEFKKEEVLVTEPEEEVEEIEEEMNENDSSPFLPGTVFKISSILNDLMETKIAKNKTNYFYKIENNSVKFAKFTAKLKGVTKNGIYSAFFKEGDFIEIDKNGKEKGTGVSALYGKNISSLNNIKNIVFSTSITNAFKILKAKNASIKDSVIIAMKSVSLEAEILYEQLVEHILVRNGFGIKNIYVVKNNKKNRQFLESLLNNKKSLYNIKYLAFNVKINYFDEKDLKNVKMEMDINSTDSLKKEKKNDFEITQ